MLARSAEALVTFCTSTWMLSGMCDFGCGGGARALGACQCRVPIKPRAGFVNGHRGDACDRATIGYIRQEEKLGPRKLYHITNSPHAEIGILIKANTTWNKKVSHVDQLER